MNKLNAARLSRAAALASNLLRELKFTFAALAIGSRTVPLADNGQLVRDLAAKAALLYRNGSGAGSAVANARSLTHVR